MTKDAGMRELDRIRTLLKEKPSAAEPRVVRLIRAAIHENSQPEAFAARPEYTPNDKPHPAITTGQQALEALLLQVGRAAGTLDREHVLGVHDLLCDAGVNEKAADMLGVHMLPLIDSGRLKVTTAVRNFALDSAAYYHSSAALSTLSDVVMGVQVQHPKLMVPDDIRTAEIEALTDRVRRVSVYREGLEQLRKGARKTTN
jgi:hypothetical protein